MVTTAWPWARNSAPNFSWQAVAAMGVAGLLASCGGGGGGGAGSTPGPITRAEAQGGDYFVYTGISANTVPTGQQPITIGSTLSYMSIAGDGTSQQMSTDDLGADAGQSVIDVNDGVASNTFLNGTSCSYAPALQSAPPYPRSVGQSWRQTSVATCGAVTDSATRTGQIVGREQLTVPAGTFDSYKAEQTASGVDSNYTVTQTSTCWYSVQRGVMLQCDHSWALTPTGSNNPSSAGTYSMRLTGWGGPARATQGTALPRFAGYWHVQYSGGASGNCAQLQVSSSGGISGNCTDAVSGTFAVTGSVNDSGAIDVTLAGGGKLTGTPSTPYSGQGSWVNGNFTGAWTATHN